MLRFESAKLEKEVLSGGSCIAVPIEIFVPTRGEPIVTAYSFCEDAARRVIEKFGDDLLSDKALKYTDSEFKAIAENIGYRHDEHENQMILEYEMRDMSQLNKKLIRGDCIKITSQAVLSKLCKNSGCDIELDSVLTARLFDRFFTVNDARGGTGLGLSIAKQLSEKMHGSITAEYSSGKLTVRVSFHE